MVSLPALTRDNLTAAKERVYFGLVLAVSICVWLVLAVTVFG